MNSSLIRSMIVGYQGHMSGPNGTITRVVIHGTVSPCETGGARANAEYFQSPNAGGLAHYVVDPNEIIGCCDEDIACWHAPPNHGSIGVELCDPQTGDDWGNENHQAMLRLAAGLVRDICDRHQLPLVWLSVDDLLAGSTGITSHANVAQAWHQSDHTDPGIYFPVDQFLQFCNPQQPAPSEDDDMPGIQFQLPDGTIVVAPKNGEKPWAVPGAGASAFHLLVGNTVGDGVLKVTDPTEAAALLALTK